MAQGYFYAGKSEQRAHFDYFFRKNPFEGGFVVFAGLAPLLELIEDYVFTASQIEYLKSQGFRPEFLDYLSRFQFRANIDALAEGEVVFPRLPILKVSGPLLHCQLIETLLLNHLNFESLVATKAARCKLAAGSGKVLAEFGLRRAQGLGGLQASRAAIIGGFTATSNVWMGMHHGLKISGTQAHAWVQSFPDELSAFRAFAEQFPTNTTLLVDTYDTLRSGVPNAITVAKEMEANGHRMNAIRLDSGDLAYLSQHARRMLDDAGLHYVKIAATNDLDEYTIETLEHQGANIDIYGVGTALVTAKGSPALGGVYKLIQVEDEPKVKISMDIEKITLPGIKRVLRYSHPSDNAFRIDGIALADEPMPTRLFHPTQPLQHTSTEGLTVEELMQPVVRDGRVVSGIASITDCADYAAKRLSQLPPEHKRFQNPHIYKVGISEKLRTLRDDLLQKHGRLA
jgi:nicotinate phosphoribosyltransferase